MAAKMTALGGALVRAADGWAWRDGTPEPRVEDLPLRRCAPNFRCITYGSGTYVEIPRRWRSAGLWPSGEVDDDAAAAIEALLEAARRARIYAEGLAELRGDHRLTRDGWLVQIEDWDRAMGRPCGCAWDRDHEAAILERARALGWGEVR